MCFWLILMCFCRKKRMTGNVLKLCQNVVTRDYECSGPDEEEY
jgi:hypothetical protein